MGGTRVAAGRRRTERGTALAEFAFVAPVLFLVLFGIIEFGSTLNDYQSLRQGTRDATRVAVVDNVPDCTTAVGTDETDDLICYVEERIGLDGDTRVRVDVTAPDLSVSGDRGSIKVCIQREVQSMTGMLAPFLDGRVLATEVTMRVEKGTEPAFVDRSEAAVSGSWSC